MSDLKQLISDAASLITDCEEPIGSGYWVKRDPEDYGCDDIADKVIEAIEASGRVTVDRARFERLLKPMQLYVQAEGIVVDFTGKGAIAFGKAFEDAVNEIRANPGDLEPLP